MSILITLVAPIDTYFIPEYWNPITLGNLFGLPIDIFTLLFGFTLGGISSVLYEELLKKTYIRSQKRHHPLKLLVIVGPISLLLLEKYSSYNFMTNILIATILMIVVILLVRRDLFKETIISGLLFAFVYTTLLSVYILFFPDVLAAWNLKHFPQIMILNVPHYEIIWAFLSGMFLGSFYEFSHDYFLRAYAVKRK